MFHYPTPPRIHTQKKEKAYQYQMNFDNFFAFNETWPDKVGSTYIFLGIDIEPCIDKSWKKG